MQKGPSVRPRMGGGMNKMPGNLSGEHFDENVANQAMQQKALSQAAADPGAMPTSGMQGQNKSPLSTKPKPQKPRPIDAKKELGYMAKDLAKGLLSFFDLHAALGIDSVQDDPEDQARKQKSFQRLQSMNKDEQEYAQKLYNEKMKKKQLEEQRKQEEEAKKKQAESNQITMPSSPRKGPKGPGGSRKQRAQTKLEQDRKGIGSVAGAN